jgi:hypothetical protein
MTFALEAAIECGRNTVTRDGQHLAMYVCMYVHMQLTPVAWPCQDAEKVNSSASKSGSCRRTGNSMLTLIPLSLQDVELRSFSPSHMQCCVMTHL